MWQPLLKITFSLLIKIFSGLLTGKVKRGLKPKEGRLAHVAESKWLKGRGGEAFPQWTRFSDKDFDVLETTEEIAKEKGDARKK